VTFDHHLCRRIAQFLADLFADPAKRLTTSADFLGLVQIVDDVYPLKIGRKRLSNRLAARVAFNSLTRWRSSAASGDASSGTSKRGNWRLSATEVFSDFCRIFHSSATGSFLQMIDPALIFMNNKTMIF
jgi:hypothetical protein